MATFEGTVTEAGWTIHVETGSHETASETEAVENLAHKFIEKQTELQASGQEFIRQSLKEGRFETDRPQPNGAAHVEEAETLTD